MIPDARRTLVTGHESLGYFAERYDLRLVGAIIPSLTTSAEPSAADLAALAETIRAEQVPAIFTELGTSPAVADAIGSRDGGEGRRADHPRPARRRLVRHVHQGHRHADRRQSALRSRARPIARPAKPTGETNLGPLIDPFINNEFMLRALAAGVLVSIACAIVGTFVVLRGLAFIGDALAHGVLPGIAGALLLGPARDPGGDRRGAGDDRGREPDHASLAPLVGHARSASCSWRCWPSAS